MRRVDKIALIALLAGFVIWSLGFVGLYALQALGCAYGWPAHRAILIAFYVLTVLALAPLAWRLPQAEGEPSTTLSHSALWANRAALVSGILVFLPVTFATTCI